MPPLPDTTVVFYRFSDAPLKTYGPRTLAYLAALVHRTQTKRCEAVLSADAGSPHGSWAPAQTLLARCVVTPKAPPRSRRPTPAMPVPVTTPQRTRRRTLQQVAFGTRKLTCDELVGLLAIAESVPPVSPLDWFTVRADVRP